MLNSENVNLERTRGIKMDELLLHNLADSWAKPNLEVSEVGGTQTFDDFGLRKKSYSNQRRKDNKRRNSDKRIIRGYIYGKCSFRN